MSKETLQGLLQKRNEILYTKSVTQEIADHLLTFVDTDARKADTGISTEGVGMVVPQEHIEKMRAEFLTVIESIDKAINKLDNTKVAENVKTVGSKKKEEKGQKKTGKAANGSQAR